MFGSLPALLDFRKLNRCLPPPLTSVNSVPGVIPFRITSFADPHQLTPIESHSYKKQGGGVLPSPLVTRHSSVTQQLLQVLPFHGLMSHFPSQLAVTSFKPKTVPLDSLHCIVHFLRTFQFLNLPAFKRTRHSPRATTSSLPTRTVSAIVSAEEGEL
jgi:hypothetical protein